MRSTQWDSNSSTARPLRFLTSAGPALRFTLAGICLAAPGCGGGDSSARSPASPSRSASPGAVAGLRGSPLGKACSRLAPGSRVTVRCPSWLPTQGARRALGAGFEIHSHTPGQCAYLVELIAKRYTASNTAPFHVFVGGRCRPFSLAERNGRWPARPNTTDYLGLVSPKPLVPGQTTAPALSVPRVVAKTAVGRSPALLCQVDTYPSGGIHGGHYALAYSDHASGYILSFHYPRGDKGERPQKRQLRLLQRTAASMTSLRPDGT